MSISINLLFADLRRRSRDGFIIGYNIFFPIIMILLLGYLASGSYGNGFSSYQYYCVVIPSFCVAMSMITAAFAGKEEAYHKTAIRYLFSPISKAQIILSKLISISIVISLCNFIVILFSKLALGLPVKARMIQVFILMTSETFAVCAIGLFIGFGMKNFIMVKNLINIPICVAAIAAGAFYPIGSLNPRLVFLLELSPLTWVNRGIFLCIFDGNSSILWGTSAVLIITGIGFTLLAIRLFRKEDYIHGDLPGYEK